MKTILRIALSVALVVASFGGVALADTNNLLQGPINQACATFTGCKVASPGNAGALLSTSLSPPPSMVTVQITGTFTGTLQLEGSIDGKNFVAETLTPSGGGTAASTFTTTGLWTGVISGVTALQIRASSWTSGTANVSLLYNALSLRGFAQYCLSCVNSIGYTAGAVATVAADGSATSSLNFATPFASSVSSLVLTPSAYSGSDNAVVSCRTSGVTTSGCVVTCAGGQTGSTVTVYYVAQGI